MASPLPPPLAVETALCSGEVHDQGAQVTRWAPAGAAPVLYVSTAASLETGRSIRGGVPVCWPWFGPGRGGGMEPAHGFVRTAPWHLVEQEAEGEDVVVTHRVSSAEVSAANWPHSYDLELRTRFGAALELTLTTTNTGTEHFVVEEALHAYLAVGDVRQVTLDGLDGRSFFDKVTGAERVQSGPVRFTGETDSVFRTSEPVVLDDPALDRQLVVSTEGAANVVVWNPWAEKAAGVADIGDDDWTGFLCVEGANAFENAVRVEPGASHAMTYRVEVRSR